MRVPPSPRSSRGEGWGEAVSAKMVRDGFAESSPSPGTECAFGSFKRSPYNGVPRYSRLARLASSRSRSRSIRRRVSSVILPSRKQRVDELALSRDQFARQPGAGGRDIMLVGIERVRQLAGAHLVPRPQQADHLVGEIALLDDGVERFQRHYPAPRAAPRFPARAPGRSRRGPCRPRRARAPPSAGTGRRRPA